MRPTRIIGVTLLMLVALALIDGPGAAHGVPFRERPWRDNPPKRVNWSTTKIAFEMRGKPWREVVEWFADQAQMWVVCKHEFPRGTFTFVYPKAREYTLIEVFDIINEILMANCNFLLVRGESVLTMVPVGKELQEQLIPRVRLEDLKDRGKTELVEVVVTLNAADDEQDMAACARRMLGDLGYVEILGKGRLLLRAPARDLRFALEVIR